MSRLFLLLTLVLSLLTVSADDLSELRDARAKWLSLPKKLRNHYFFELEYWCYCDRCVTSPRLVRVKEGSIVKVKWAERMFKQICAEKANKDEVAKFLENSIVFTVDEMFDELAQIDFFTGNMIFSGSTKKQKRAAVVPLFFS